jgi:hypothetical protein
MLVWLLSDELESQASGDTGAGHVGLVVMNLNVVDRRDGKRGIGQQRRRRSGESSTQKRWVNPVPDLEHPRLPPMKPTPARNVSFSDHGERNIAAVQPFPLTLREHRATLVQRQRLGRHPGHPRAQVLGTLRHRCRKDLCVALTPSLQHHAATLDPLRQPNTGVSAHRANIAVAVPLSLGATSNSVALPLARGSDTLEDSLARAERAPDSPGLSR